MQGGMVRSQRAQGAARVALHGHAGDVVKGGGVQGTWCGEGDYTYLWA